MAARRREDPGRCEWVAGGDDLMLRYHDEEWGVPSHDDRHLFEMLTLEGAQAGLSWSTILRKREGYRQAFAEWDIERIARFNRRTIERLLRDPGIVRNRAKVESTVSNARAALDVRDRVGSLDAYLWELAGDPAPRKPSRRLADLPAETDASRAMSRQLRNDGFRFVGPTICYAFMQAVGMVNDHVVSCFRREQIPGAP